MIKDSLKFESNKLGIIGFVVIIAVAMAFSGDALAKKDDKHDVKKVVATKDVKAVAKKDAKKDDKKVAKKDDKKKAGGLLTTPEGLAFDQTAPIELMMLFDSKGNAMNPVTRLSSISLQSAGPATATLNAVPVPAAFWLFGTALIGFIGISRRTNLS